MLSGPSPSDRSLTSSNVGPVEVSFLDFRLESGHFISPPARVKGEDALISNNIATSWSLVDGSKKNIKNRPEQRSPGQSFRWNGASRVLGELIQRGFYLQQKLLKVFRDNEMMRTSGSCEHFYNPGVDENENRQQPQTERERTPQETPFLNDKAL